MDTETDADGTGHGHGTDAVALLSMYRSSRYLTRIALYLIELSFDKLSSSSSLEL